VGYYSALEHGALLTKVQDPEPQLRNGNARGISWRRRDLGEVVAGKDYLLYLRRKRNGAYVVVGVRDLEKVFGGSSKSAHLGEHSPTMNALRKTEDACIEPYCPLHRPTFKVTTS
jgi:hypothetical protein